MPERPPYRSKHDRLLAARTDRRDRQARPCEFGDCLQVGPGFGGKILPPACLVRGGPPTWKLRVHGHATGERFAIVGHEIALRLPVTIADASFYRFERIQSVDIRHSQLVDPVNHAGVARGHRIEPAAATWPA